MTSWTHCLWESNILWIVSLKGQTGVQWYENKQTWSGQRYSSARLAVYWQSGDAACSAIGVTKVSDVIWFSDVIINSFLTSTCPILIVSVIIFWCYFWHCCCRRCSRCCSGSGCWNCVSQSDLPSLAGAHPTDVTGVPATGCAALTHVRLNPHHALGRGRYI